MAAVVRILEVASHQPVECVRAQARADRFQSSRERFACPGVLRARRRRRRSQREGGAGSRPSSRVAGERGRRARALPSASARWPGGPPVSPVRSPLARSASMRCALTGRPLDRRADEPPELDLGHPGLGPGPCLPLAYVAEREGGAEALDLVRILDGAGGSERARRVHEGEPARERGLAASRARRRDGGRRPLRRARERRPRPGRAGRW